MQSITKHASRAGEKLRREGLVAGRLTAFAHTSPHGSGPFYHGSRTTTLVPMTCDTRHLVAAARQCIEASYRDGFAYAKAGVILDDLRPESEAPLPLLTVQSAASPPLMSALDTLNARFGRGAVRLAAQGISEGWGLKSDHKSPCYTTQWNELPIAKAY